MTTTRPEEFKAARNRLLRLVSFRLRSRFEAGETLRREGYTGPVIEAALDEMARLGYVDDARFCSEYAYSRFRRGYGPHRICLELKQKGVSANLVEEKLTTLFCGTVELDQARSLLAKRLAAGYDPADRKVWWRCAAFLQRRGFGKEIIRQVLREYLCEEESFS